MSSSKPIAVILGLLVMASLAPLGQASAQGISITTTASPSLEHGQVLLKLTIANQGGRPARDLIMHVRHLGRDTATPGPPTLGPGKTSRHTLGLGPAPAEPGVFPLLVRVVFHDEAMRPFTSLAVGLLEVGAAGPALVTVSGRPAEVPGRGEMTFTLTSRAPRPLTLDVSFLTPFEVTAMHRSPRVVLEPGETRDLAVRLHAASSATGASFPVFAVARYSYDGRKLACAANALVHVAGPLEPLTPWRPYLAVAVALLLAAIIGLELARPWPARQQG